MTAEQLLQELEALTHKARIRRMIELGRTAAQDPSIVATLTTLKQGDFYERFLALHSCFGNYDGAHILHALTDPSRIIRGVALNLAALVYNEEQLQKALTIVPRDGRLPLLWKLHHRGYDTLIDAFLEHLAATNDPQLQKLLPNGSSSLVRRFITRFQHKMGLVDWRRLARHHPTIAFELLQARAEATTSLDLQLLSFVNSVLPLLADKLPDQALTLVETLARFVPFNRLNLQALLLKRPIQLVDLLLRGEDLGEIDLYCIAHKLDDERLFALLTIYPLKLVSASLWISRVKPERRLTLFPILAQIERDQDSCVPTYLLECLPRVQREQEGRHHLALSALANKLEKRLPYAAFLPWDEARSLLDPFLHDPSQAIRIVALEALTKIVRYEREHLADVLPIIQEHLSEPEPVRGTLVNYLANLPRSIWRLKHLADLEQIIDATVNAFDASPFSSSALLLLLTRLFACAPEWSATQFASIAQARGLTFYYQCIEDKLSDADVQLIGPALRPVLLSWVEEKNEKVLQEALSLFGKRVRVFAELLDALELLLSLSPSFEFGDMILSTIIKYRPVRAAQLIPDLLQRHQDWITYPAVSTYLCQQRQDLLTPFLSQRKYSKLFCNIHTIGSRRRKRITKPTTKGFTLLTFQQQTIFAQTLLSEINDATNDHYTIIQAITQLAALPAIPVEYILALASTSQRPLIRDTSLLQLHRLDTGQGIPLLLTALQDQRAVRAIYALRPFLLAVPAQEALTILHTIPLTKVTIAKEAIRLLGQLAGEEAYQELLAFDAQELQRDVRIAYLRALWYHLERDETWHILEREAQSADINIALGTAHMSIVPPLAKEYHNRKRFRRRRSMHSSTQDFLWFSEWNMLTMTSLSGEHLSPKAQQRLMHLFASLLDRLEIAVRTAVLRGCTRLPAADEEQFLLARLLNAMDSDNDDICQAATRAVFGTCMTSDAPFIGQAIGRLLPNRSALQTMLQELYGAHFVNKGQFLPVVRAVLEALASDPITIELRVELAIALLPWNEVATFLKMAVTSGEFHAGAFNRACNMFDGVIITHTRGDRPDIKDIVRLEEALATSQDERLRRIALAALIAQAEMQQGWNAERRARLQRYLADPSVLVTSAAQFTFLPTKEE